MNHKIWQRLFAVIMLLGMVISPFQVGQVSAKPAGQGDTPPKPAVGSKVAPSGDSKSSSARQGSAPTAPIKPAISPEQVLAKIHPDLQALLNEATLSFTESTGKAQLKQGEAVLVSILTDYDEKAGVGNVLLERIKAYFVDSKVFAEPPMGGVQILNGRVLPSNLMKIASIGGVRRIVPLTPVKTEYDNVPPDGPKPEYTPGANEWAKLRENAATVREGSLPWSEAKAFGDGRVQPAAPEDWFEIMPEGPHKAQAAWARGYQGEGVAVAINDDGVDFAHPDLMGTQRIYSSTVKPYLNGWPMVMDAFGMRAYFNDMAFGTPYVSGGFAGVTYIDTSATPTVFSCGTGLRCFSFTPLIDFGVDGLEHNYVISSTMSASGVVHVGTHLDESLRDYVWGEKVAVLVTDPNTAGVYDTVYVDLDDDYDFRDEKAVTRADTSSPAAMEASKNNPISYRDMNNDGLADLSGGMLYFIGDGVHYIPGTDYLFLFGYFGFPAPGNGDLIAMHGPWLSGYSHGTQCASNVVAQGVIDGLVPSFSDLAPGPGVPAAAVYGMAPEADLIPMNTAYGFSGGITNRDAFYLAAYGWDGYNQLGFGLGVPTPTPHADTDGIQIQSNSWGYSDQFNDGWDFDGQVIDDVIRRRAPYLQFLFSTGNGGPGYGTETPPSAHLGIAVGASTEYGSTGWDTITNTNQINFNDVVAFSNSGPGANSGAGVDVLAGGAYAAGAEELNYYSISTWGVLDGNLSWATWGGTSRSSPVAAGVLALLYQAYKDAHGAWPTAQVAKSLLMSTATDVNSNILRQGAGSVNADRGTAVASGEYGTYMDGSSADWQPGDFRGVDYPAFAHVVEPGGTYNKTFTVLNDSPNPVTVDLSDATLSLIRSQELDYTITAEMVAAENIFGPENRDSAFKGFNFFIPITATAGMDPSWYNLDVPVDTDLMVVRQIFPFDEFDIDGDYNLDNRFVLTIYNWDDINLDGNVWEDKNDNGVVNFIIDEAINQIDGFQELVWDDARTELDRWEFGRFGYNRTYGNTNELMVHDPLTRMHDGLFIGVRHVFSPIAETIDTHLRYRVEFYKKANVPWLSTDVNNLDVPALGSASFVGTVNVPADILGGDYEAAIEVFDPAGTITDSSNTIVIPVVMNVSEDFDGANTFGGFDSYLQDAGGPYNNGALRGNFDWAWREESGDWRAFYMEIDNRPVASPVWSESFDAAPVGWTVLDNNSSGLIWDSLTNCGEAANYTGGSGGLACASSDMFGSAAYDTELRSPVFALPTGASAAVTFKANFQNYGLDLMDVDISSNGGTSWTNLLSWNSDQGAFRSATGVNAEVDLSAYLGMSNLMLRWRYYDLESGSWDWYAQIDDVVVELRDYPFPTDADIIVKDEWADTAPHTDIDTIALGPSPTPLSPYDFGVWTTNGYNPAFYGPYTLETVGSSADVRSDRSIWNFNTTSGTNEEWITFPIQDGLHRLLNHNVLFEGDQFDVVFTTTVGLLTVDNHSFAIDTYQSNGELGTVILQSTLDFPNLVADGFVSQVNTTNLVNEPIDFTGTGTLEWNQQFSVADGVSIDLTTSSIDIGDIDLYLFFYDGTNWVQRGSSAGATADENIFFDNPEDGNWLVAIDNYSGPAGHFNLTMDVTVRAPGSSVTFTGTTANPVPANTPMPLTINYAGLDTPGLYTGVILVGNTGAPALKEIPFAIMRHPESAFVQKSVDATTAFAGDNLTYSVDVFNLSDPAAEWEFSDPIPADTEFVSVSGGVEDAIVVFDEGFEGTWPPTGWEVVVITGTGWNTTSFWGVTNDTPGSNGQAADADADAFGEGMETELWSPPIDLTGLTTPELVFDSNFQYFSTGDIGYLDISTNNGTDWTNLWSIATDEPATGTTHTFDLSAYSGDVIRLRWHFVAPGWDWFWLIDDVQVLQSTFIPFTYDSVADAVVLSGALPLSGMQIANESFEHAGSLAPGWTTDTRGAGVREWIVLSTSDFAPGVHTGTYAMWHNFEVAEDDSWLFSPDVTVTPSANQLSFWAVSDTEFPGATVTLYATDTSGNVIDTLWDLVSDEAWATFEYRQVSIDMSAYEGQTIKLAWQYHGFDGESFGLDDVRLPGVEDEWLPVGTAEITVAVSNTVSAGDFITNTATLEATHILPQGDQTEAASASAVTHIGMEDFVSSYKVASPAVSSGGTIEYEVHVINSGDALAHVTLNDVLPPFTTFDDLNNAPPNQYLTYDAGTNAVMWEGNVAPGEEWVFTYWVTVDRDHVWRLGDIITNTADLAWGVDVMHLSADTDIVFGNLIYMAIVFK